MRESVLWRKQARIIMLITQYLHISAEKALELYYNSELSSKLNNPATGLQLMSDQYILQDFITEYNNLSTNRK